MTVRLSLTADDPRADGITVSTTVEVDLDDPRWQARLVDAVAGRAEEGARRLRDVLVAQAALPDYGFVPLAAVVPTAGSRR